MTHSAPSIGTRSTLTVRLQRQLFKLSLASEPAAHLPPMSKFAAEKTSSTIYWVKLKQPDNQKTSSVLSRKYIE